MKKLWLWFLARFRISRSAICETSRGMGVIDYHTFEDACGPENPKAMWGLWENGLLTCVWCSKRFFA